ncbi:LOW QUALITY PROTEIN: hypothetical protein HID58_069369, partial [Brassica napus]
DLCEYHETMDKLVKSSISWKGGRSLGLVPGFFLAGTWSVPLSGTRGPGSCPEAGGNDTGDSAPSVSLSWVPLKPELILNPGWREFLLERTEVFDMRFNPLGRRSNAGRVVLRVPLVPQVPETGPFLPTLFLSEMKAESGLSAYSSSIVSMDSSDPSLDLTAEVEDPKAIVSLNVSPVAEGNRYPPIGPPSVIGVEEVADWRMKYNLPVDVIIRVPGPEDRVSDFGVDEVHVYEGYFESGQLNPPAWRTLIALQNLGLPAFAGNWTEKFAFTRLPGFLPIWQLEGRLAVRVTNAKKVLIVSCFLEADLPRVDYSSGRETIERMLRLPIERRQIPFLVSKAALKCCSIWGEMSGSKGDEALAEYKKALECLPTSTRRYFLRIQCSWHKRKIPLWPFSRSRVTCFRSDGQVASQLFHLGERMVGAASTKAEMEALASQLHEEKDVAIAKNKEIKALRLKARNQEQAGELAAMENVSLRGQLKNREEELNDLKDTVETFEAEKAMAVNGAKVVARWELMQECLNGQTDSWDPANVLVQYKTVKITEAELLGLPTPSFEGEPQVPGDMEAEKMPEPAADDPPAS